MHADLARARYSSVAFAGLATKWPRRISKMGNGGLRKALYFPAVVASRHNRALRQFAERLRSRDKSNMLIIVTVMRKLLTLAYGVLKSGMAFRKDVLPA